MNFQNLENNLVEYKSLVDQRKNVIHVRLTNVADHLKHIDLLRRNGPTMAARTVGPFFKLMEKDCILPE